MTCLNTIVTLLCPWLISVYVHCKYISMFGNSNRRRFSLHLLHSVSIVVPEVKVMEPYVITRMVFHNARNALSENEQTGLNHYNVNCQEGLDQARLNCFYKIPEVKTCFCLLYPALLLHYTCLIWQWIFSKTSDTRKPKGPFDDV